MRPEDVPAEGRVYPEIIPIADEHFERIARAEAFIDGREWMAMPKADRERYIARVRGFMPVVMSAIVPAVTNAVYPLIAAAERERCAKVADEAEEKCSKAFSAATGSNPTRDANYQRSRMAFAIASAIRALPDTGE